MGVLDDLFGNKDVIYGSTSTSPLFSVGAHLATDFKRSVITQAILREEDIIEGILWVSENSPLSIDLHKYYKEATRLLGPTKVTYNGNSSKAFTDIGEKSTTLFGTVPITAIRTNMSWLKEDTDTYTNTEELLTHLPVDLTKLIKGLKEGEDVEKMDDIMLGASVSQFPVKDTEGNLSTDLNKALAQYNHDFWTKIHDTANVDHGASANHTRVSDRSFHGANGIGNNNNTGIGNAASGADGAGAGAGISGNGSGFGEGSQNV